MQCKVTNQKAAYTLLPSPSMMLKQHILNKVLSITKICIVIKAGIQNE